MSANKGRRPSIARDRLNVFGTLVIALFTIWMAPAVFVAHALSRRGLGFGESLFYALLAPPLVCILAATYKRPGAEDRMSSDHRGSGQFSRTGLRALRIFAIGVVVVAGIAIGKEPLAQLGRFVAYLEAVAERGANFDACAQRDSIPECFPTPDLSVIGAAVADISSTFRQKRSVKSKSGETIAVALLQNEAAVAIARVHPEKTAQVIGVNTRTESPETTVPDTMPPETTVETPLAKGASHPRGDGLEMTANDPEIVQESSGNWLVRSVQSSLTKLGYQPGPIDGVFGRKTKRAIERFEADHNIPGSGIPSASLATYLVGKVRATAVADTAAGTAQPLSVEGEISEAVENVDIDPPSKEHASKEIGVTEQMARINPSDKSNFPTRLTRRQQASTHDLAEPR